MYKLYTTYLSNMKNIPKSCKIVIIMRFPPFIPEDSNIYHAIELSPQGKILMDYKDNNDFESFKDKFWEQLNFDKDAQLSLKQIGYALENNNDICLVCCEKDNTNCHRRLLGEFFEFLGYEWEEL